MNKQEKFEQLQYETYKTALFGCFALAIASAVGYDQTTSLKTMFSWFFFLFSLATCLSLYLFIIFYKKLRLRYGSKVKVQKKEETPWIVKVGSDFFIGLTGGLMVVLYNKLWEPYVAWVALFFAIVMVVVGYQKYS